MKEPRRPPGPRPPPPQPAFAGDLPILAERERIAQLVRDHPVVIVCGETGSGKSTQLPQICLAAGRGRERLIGHTQPRRIAARTLASRIARELATEPGEAVGFKVRFQDHVGPNAYIKVMTDGMLLAEIQGDRRLERYDTLIIDEAHERSLNIDFLLGYLRTLLPVRPDLRVIVTSATIDLARLSQYFGTAPVVEVLGRSFPVEIRYRDAPGEELSEAVVAAVEEACAATGGDGLVFLPGERDIRECAEALRKHHPPHTEILGLYARLSVGEQERVFAPHRGRRIVLATNVAETSLTVPGIRFVVDSGLARVSRYSSASQVQRLPVEPVSQASATQRAGRCGRIAPGVCIRLYSEADYGRRAPFTDPEIRRTSLAAVILRMLDQRLGPLEEFPFIDPPPRKLVNDGYRTLQELGAIDEQHRLTDTGRALARLPVDPRVGRILLAGGRHGALAEALVIGAALSIQDPRERAREGAPGSEPHRAFDDKRSDFLALLALYRAWCEQRRHLSRRKLAAWCRDQLLSPARMREWDEIYHQLHALMREMGHALNEQPAGYGALHQALLAGLWPHCAQRGEKGDYVTARGRRARIFPGSGLRKAQPPWIFAGALVQTRELYAHLVAQVDVRWIERAAAHLVRRHHSDPHYDAGTGEVLAFEEVTLYGLVLAARRAVRYAPLDPVEARRVFMHDALVNDALASDAPWARHNRALLASLEEEEQRTRRAGVRPDEEHLLAFFDQRLGADVCSAARFERWRRHAERRTPRILFMDESDVRRAGPLGADRFPDVLEVAGLRLPLRYRFAPGEDDDGVTVTVPAAVLRRLPDHAFDRLVPGWLEELLAALVRTLPGRLRARCAPAPDYARAALPAVAPAREPLVVALAAELARMTGVAIPAQEFRPHALPAHLRMRIEVTGEDGAVLASGRELAELKDAAGSIAGDHELPSPGFGRTGLTTWEFPDLPPKVPLQAGGLHVDGFPALVDDGASVALRVLDTAEAARESTRAGVVRLALLACAPAARQLRRSLPQRQAMCLHFAAVAPCETLIEDLVETAAMRAFVGDGPPARSRAQFEAALAAGRGRLVPIATELAHTLAPALAAAHEARLQIAALAGRAPDETIADMRSQLEHLLYPGFIGATPQRWLARYPAWLKALNVRLERLASAPARPDPRVAEIASRWRAWLALPPGGEAREHYRWMLEEYRVSLFAAPMKTSEPVSAKRLDALWGEAVGGREARR